MEQEILKTLQEIRTAIYILMAVVIVGVLVNGIRGAISLRGQLRRELDHVFNDEASRLFDKGDFAALIDHCRQKLKGNPNHAYALWYIAKAYYQQQQYDKAKEYFERLSQYEPSWEEDHVRPYLAKIGKEQ